MSEAGMTSQRHRSAGIRKTLWATRKLSFSSQFPTNPLRSLRLFLRTWRGRVKYSKYSTLFDMVSLLVFTSSRRGFSLRTTEEFNEFIQLQAATDRDSLMSFWLPCRVFLFQKTFSAFTNEVSKEVLKKLRLLALRNISNIYDENLFRLDAGIN